jgi:uncharacterized protein YcsI (UPF0317 family)
MRTSKKPTWDCDVDKTLHSLTPREIRELCRTNTFAGQTAGLARGHVQANMMILPREFAFDFLLFCQRNPKPCPLVEVLEPGDIEPYCAPGGDIRTDLPAYRIFEEGRLVNEVTDVSSYWRDDLVTFLIGCSFSFEDALMAGGISLRHVELKRNVAMYKTSMPCRSAGCFEGNMVVSMRPVKSRDIARAVEISARFPEVHGAPVHIGHPAKIGISDLSLPDYGESVPLMDDELPVFWACGVTPQYVAELSRIPFCITHSPGKMLVTDFITNK